MFTRWMPRTPSSVTTLFYTPVSTPIDTTDKDPIAEPSQLQQDSEGALVTDSVSDHTERPSESIQAASTVADVQETNEPNPAEEASPIHSADTMNQPMQAPAPVAHDFADEEREVESGDLHDVKHQSMIPSTNARPASPSSIGHGTFSAGAGTVSGAPRDSVDAVLHSRAAAAEENLSPEVEAKLNKTEAKDAKRLSKIIKDEAKAEDMLLKAAIKDLSKLQKVQKEAAVNEASTLSAHAKAVRNEQKLNKAYLEAKGRWEVASANLKAKTEQLDTTRQNAAQQTALLQEKANEVERSRQQKAADDRERQARLAALKSGPAV